MFPDQIREILQTILDRDHVKLDERISTWYCIDAQYDYLHEKFYALMESERYGEDAGHILCEVSGPKYIEIAETWDSIQDTLDDLDEDYDLYSIDDEFPEEWDE